MLTPANNLHQQWYADSMMYASQYDQYGVPLQDMVGSQTVQTHRQLIADWLPLSLTVSSKWLCQR